MHGQFAWYELVSNDVEAAKRFYGAVVGWTAEQQSPDYTVFKTGKHGVAGVYPMGEEMQGARPGWIGYIVADDVDATVDQIVQAGGKVHKGPQDVPGMLRFAVVSDPQGIAFIVFKPDPAMGSPERPAPGTQGTFGWSELVAPDWQADWTFYEGLFGWKKGMAVDMREMGIYQTFGTQGGDAIGDMGGMMDKPAGMPIPAGWTYYICVDGINAAVERIKAAGGSITNGPHPVPGGYWIVQGLDLEGAAFALLSVTE